MHTLFPSVKFGSQFDFTTFSALLMRIGTESSVMKCDVLRLAGDKFKIIDGVICSVMIFVMNNLARKKRPSEMLLHDVAMFKDSLPVNINKAVSPENRSAFVSSMITSSKCCTAASEGTKPRWRPILVSASLGHEYLATGFAHR